MVADVSTQMSNMYETNSENVAELIAQPTMLVLLGCFEAISSIAILRYDRNKVKLLLESSKRFDRNPKYMDWAHSHIWWIIMIIPFNREMNILLWVIGTI